MKITRQIKFHQITVFGLLFLLSALFLLTFKTKLQGGVYVDTAPHSDYKKECHPKMEYALYKMMEVCFLHGVEEAKEFAHKRSIGLNDDLVRVVLNTQLVGTSEIEISTSVSSVKSLVEILGGNIETSYHQLIQCNVPIDALQNLADRKSIRYISLPLKPQLYVTSEGVTKTGADKWQSLIPYRGVGTKICVLDGGFDGYDVLLGTELPSSLTTRSFKINKDIYGGTSHGTACAEIIHDMAPNAQMLLVNYSTRVEMREAVNWILTQGVDVISHSAGHTLYGPGDGTGPICDLVKQAVDNGITWVNAAGNEAQKHWGGIFNDPDGNGWHNFSNSDERLVFSVPENRDASLYVFLKWDDWGSWDGANYSGSNQDYDLYLEKWNGSTYIAYEQSKNIQNGTQEPIEQIGFSYPAITKWAVRIKKSNATKNLRLDVYVSHSIDDASYLVSAGSLGIPGDSPHAFTVGAIDWSNFSYHAYSSRGPTLDGRIKPDICAPSGVSVVSNGGLRFFGTSAAAPHVAGAIALLKGKTPFDLDKIKAIIEGRAVELGQAGKDNLHGHGGLKLD